jgi:CRP/FNR family transcriptional regulator
MSEKEPLEPGKANPLRWKNFRHLSKHELQLINENRCEATFKAGEVILKQDSPASSVLFLISGMAKVYNESERGKNFLIEIVQPGALVMSPGAYVNLRNSFSVAALNLVQACFIDFNIFRQLVKTNNAFAESLLEDLCIKSSNLQIKMVNLTQKKMPGRLAEALLNFADEVFRSDEFELPLTRYELGEMTNMAKESVVRILKEMDESGVISSRSASIRILDRQKLALISVRD